MVDTPKASKAKAAIWSARVSMSVSMREPAGVSQLISLATRSDSAMVHLRGDPKQVAAVLTKLHRPIARVSASISMAGHSPVEHGTIADSATVGLKRPVADSAKVGLKRSVAGSAKVGLKRAVADSARVGLKRPVADSARVGLKRPVADSAQVGLTPRSRT